MRRKMLPWALLLAIFPHGCDGMLAGGAGPHPAQRSVPPEEGNGPDSAPDAEESSSDAGPAADLLLAADAPSTPDAGLGLDQASPSTPDAKTLPPPKPDVGTLPPPKPDASTLPPPKPDAGTPTPIPAPVGQLPTFVNLDWSAFPVDPGPGYPVKGKLLVVSQSGSDSAAGNAAAPLRTINKAVSLAQAGDVIQVQAGTYNEGVDGYRALVIDKGVTITAAPGQQVNVTAKSGYKYGVEIAASNVVLNGIDLKGYVYSVQIGGSQAAQKNVVISNLTITAPASGWTEGIIAYADTHKKGFATSQGLLIKNVEVQNTTMGISCNAGPCTDWKLENVTVVGQGGSGSGADAIAVEDGDNMLFYRVDVSKVAADGIDTKATRVVVWDCHVHDLERNGIKLWHGGDIVNTLVHHTGADAAIVTEQGPKTRLLHSTVVYHNKNQASGYSMTFGYDSQATQTVEIVNSIVGNNNGGLYLNKNSAVTIQNSVFFGVDNGEVLEQGSTAVTLSQGAAKLAGLGLGGGNLFADPKLDSGYHLSPGSPAIDLGKPLTTAYPAHDYMANPRVKGNAPDPGPFEDY